MIPSKPIAASRVLLISFLVDLLDVILGVVVTILSGSVVMLAQALEGAADLTSSGLLVFGLRRSRKKADITHPFGYGRELYFWTMISALIMLAITATLTIHFGIDRYLNPRPVKNTLIANVVLALTVVTNGYALSLSLRRLLSDKPLSKIWAIFLSSPLIETKTALILDLMGTVASVIGLASLCFYALTGNSHFDSIGAVLIGLVLAFFAIVLLLAVKDLLIGKGVSRQTLEIIKNAATKVEHVRSVQGLRATHTGPESIMINIDINAHNDLTTDQLEKVIDKVKTEIKKDLPQASHIQVELES